MHLTTAIFCDRRFFFAPTHFDEEFLQVGIGEAGDMAVLIIGHLLQQAQQHFIIVSGHIVRAVVGDIAPTSISTYPTSRKNNCNASLPVEIR